MSSQPRGTTAERFAALNPGVPPEALEKITTVGALAPDGARARGRQRVRVGKTFQRELVSTHENYLNKGWGFVLEQHPPFVRARDGWRPVGPGRCDYAGHVNLRLNAAASDHLQSVPAREGAPMPVYFDAKVLSVEHATYHHLQRDQHQLIDLRAALRGGGYAFLLVCAPHVQRAFLLDIGTHFTALMRDVGVTLWRHKDPLETDLPHCGWTPAIGWHWAPALAGLTRGEYLGAKPQSG